MLTFIDFILPLVLIILIIVPLIKVFNGKHQKATVKRALAKHVVGFFTVVALIFFVQLFVTFLGDLGK